MDLYVPYPKLLLFYGGPFSQWSASPFIIDGIEYNCAEQYMMAEKARVHGQPDIQKQIMATGNPAKQKALGRSIPNYSQEIWKPVAKDVVMKGSMAKYSQNKSHMTALASTKRMTLVEASPTDVVWGIGWAEEDPEARIVSKWRGTNWLGEILTKLRIELIGE